MSLKNHVILVTGASGALGGLLAQAIAKAGAEVILLGKTVKKLEYTYDQIVKAGGSAAIYPMDLARATWEDYLSLAETLQREYGRLDGILHAAAHFKALTPLEHHDLQDWAVSLHINLTAPFLLSRACLPLLKASEKGHLVFIGDELAKAPQAYWGAYGVAKAALQQMANMFALEHPNDLLVRHISLPPFNSPLRQKAYRPEVCKDLPLPTEWIELCLAALD